MNRWIGAGEIQQDSRFSFIAYGGGLCQFILTIDDSFRDRAGRIHRRLHHQPVRIYGDAARAWSENLKAGARVRVEGPIRFNRYPSGDVLLECCAEKVILLPAA